MVAAALTAKVTLNSLELWVPYVEPSLKIEKLITQRLNTNNPIQVLFKKRTMNNISIPTGAKYSWKIGNVSSSVRFLFIAFKLSDPPLNTVNNSLFTMVNGNNQITSMRVQLNNLYYPIDNMKMNFKDYKIAEPYNAYVNACKSFGVEPQLDLLVQEYRDLYPIICFDTSACPESLQSNGIDITIHIEKSPALTLEGYCLVLEDSIWNIEVAEGRMLRLS